MRKLVPIALVAGILSALISASLPAGAAPSLFRVSPPPDQPDLVVQSVDGPSSAEPGQAISVHNSVYNAGSAVSGASLARLYLSTDTFISPPDTLLAQRGVGSLPPSATSAEDTGLTIPVTVALGSYYLGAIADADGEVEESDEDNNAGYDPVPIAITAHISGVVFEDQNGSTSQDPGETGLPDVAVTLCLDSTIVLTATTAADGTYVFSGLATGGYTVEETDPPGYVSTTPNVVQVSVPPSGAADFGDKAEDAYRVCLPMTVGNYTSHPLGPHLFLPLATRNWTGGQ